MVATVQHEFQSISGREHLLEIDIDWCVENDSIGWYEYWGYRFFDDRSDYPSFENYQAWIIHEGIKRKIDTKKLNTEHDKRIVEFCEEKIIDLFETYQERDHFE